MRDREALIERIAKGMAEFAQDPEMETCTDAIEFVLKAIEEDHLIIPKRTVSDKPLPDLSNAFVEHEAPEDSFIRDSEIACPACGGSGHKDDISPMAIASLAKPLEWIDESVRWGRPTYKAKGLPIVLRKTSDLLRWEFVTEYATHFISVNEADFDEAVIAADKHYRAELAKHFDREGQ
ncbi:hypothetical protein [Cohaesibacter gelatinilyticus]|uniref:Uncharacterized protein n=1 Tax=Cohaesibacter gelatinilyticus TaxID=372072 RepID=A0A285PIW8_9HYPH|nr:hypothetical protein [Cohaesibacter gelatinilyticus]SNZ21672.1 hypothetical protein SAMN06265368_4797 [Cohaesibacter gelatinilyticus]